MRRTPRPPVIAIRILLCAPVLGLGLTGCWTPPTADVQPSGEPRLIQAGIPVTARREPAVVQSVDSATRTLVVWTPGEPQSSVTYKVGPTISSLQEIEAGDKVEVTTTAQLSVYVLRDGRLPGATPETVDVGARVLSVDPSYRLLTLQYPNGQTETYKVKRDVKLQEMSAGDAVVVHEGEVIALKRKRR